MRQKAFTREERQKETRALGNVRLACDEFFGIGLELEHRTVRATIEVVDDLGIVERTAEDHSAGRTLGGVNADEVSIAR